MPARRVRTLEGRHRLCEASSLPNVAALTRESPSVARVSSVFNAQLGSASRDAVSLAQRFGCSVADNFAGCGHPIAARRREFVMSVASVEIREARRDEAVASSEVTVYEADGRVSSRLLGIVGAVTARA